jgi:hypothetical protein
VKDASGQIHREGKIGSTRRELACWMQTLPQPWTVAMEATIFSGWIYDHLPLTALDRLPAEILSKAWRIESLHKAFGESE